MILKTVKSFSAALPMAVVGLLLVGAGVSSQQRGAQPNLQPGPNRGQNQGRARVIVELNLPSAHEPEANLPDAATVVTQRQLISSRVAQVLAKLPPGSGRVLRQFLTVPYVALEVTPEGRAALDGLGGDILRIFNDELLFPTLVESVPLVEADQAWAAGYDGTGSVIAVLDTGIDGSHPALTGKVVQEACFSTNDPGICESLCPNGQEQQVGPGSAAPCPSDCLHGTHVAGIAAGNDSAHVPPIAGVARGAQVFAVQVFTRVIDPETCGGTAPCTGAFTSDVIAGLEHVYSVSRPGLAVVPTRPMCCMRRSWCWCHLRPGRCPCHRRPSSSWSPWPAWWPRSPWAGRSLGRRSSPASCEPHRGGSPGRLTA